MAFLWEDKSNDKTKLFENTTSLLYVIVNAKIMFLLLGVSFIALLNNNLIGILVAGTVSVGTYLMVKSFFDQFWQGFNRQFAISYDGIHFRWGLGKDLELFVPFSSITKVTHITYANNPLSTLYFDTNDPTILNRYPQLATDESFKLCFDSIKDGHTAHQLIEDLRKNIKITAPYDQDGKSIYSILPTWINRVFCSIAFLFIFYGIYTTLSIVDINLLSSQEVQTTILKQTKVAYFDVAFNYQMETPEGYKFNLETPLNMIGKDVTLELSPLFSRTTDISVFANRSYYLLSPYGGISLLSRLLAILFTTLIGLYILFKRGFISLEDFGLFIVFPSILLYTTTSLFPFSYF